MLLTNSYVYRHEIDTGEEVINTWGVVAAFDSGECFLCPDISVDRSEAASFAKGIVQQNLSPAQLPLAACAYIENLSLVY